MTEPDAAARRVERTRRILIVALVVLVGVVATGTSWQREASQADDDGAVAARRAADRLAAVASTMEASLSGAAGVVRGDEVDRLAFIAFASDLAQSSGLTSLALVEIVPSDERAAYERATGRPIIDRTDGEARRAPARPVHYPVLAVVPVTDTSAQLLGFDLLGDPVRARAAEIARDSGHIVFSEPLLAQPTGTRAFFVVQPIYRFGGPFETVAERRANLVGFTATAYGSDALDAELADVLPGGSSYEIRDRDLRLASSEEQPTGGIRTEVPAAGRTWTLVVDPTEHADHSVTVLLGLLTVIVGGGLAYELARGARYNELLRRNTRRAEQLASLAERLSSASTVEQIRRTTTSAALSPVGAAATSIGLIAGDVLQVEHGDSVPEEYRSSQELPLTAALAFTEVARTGTALEFVDQASYDAAFPDAAGPRVGGRAVLPLRRADGRTIGSMGHLWDEPVRFDDELRSTLRTMADLTGQALERVRLAEIRAEASRHTEHLARLTQGLATRRSTDDVMRFLTEGVLGPLDAVHAAVGIVDGDQLRRHFTPGPRTDLLAAVVPDAVPLDADAPLAEAARTGEAVLLPDVEAVRDRYPDLVDGWRALGFVATANLPLRNRLGELLGALGIAWDDRVDLDALRDRLSTIAGIAGQTLDRAILSDAEHRLVRELQRSFLLPLPPHPGLLTAQRYLPAAQEVGMGGDWYEGIARSDGRYVVVVGDVAGHGITAVAEMAELRSVIGAVVAMELPVERVFPLATSLPRRDPPIVASAALVEIDVESGSLRYACAGHPPPVVRLPDGQVSLLEEGRHPLLGMPMSPGDAGRFDFPPGALLVAYTDGLIERRDEDFDDSLGRLVREVEALVDLAPEAVADRLLDRLVTDDDQPDDVALAVVVRPA